MDYEDKLISKYVEALGEEYNAFYVYKHIFKYLTEKTQQVKILAIMEEEIHHYEIIFEMLFPINGQGVHTQLEKAFKEELCRMRDEMKACIEKLKKN